MRKISQYIAQIDQQLQDLYEQIEKEIPGSGVQQKPQMSDEVQTLRAKHDSGARDLKNIKWVVIHSTESGSAKSTAQYFQAPQSTGSTQFVVGEDGVFRTLPDAAEPWAAPGANRDGLHIEIVGYASMKREDWLKRQKTLKNAASIISSWCSTYGIPTQFVDAAGLIAGKKGITTHAEVSKAFKKSNHTDPGSGFPLDVILGMI
jgi:hypothetical protein